MELDQNSLYALILERQKLKSDIEVLNGKVSELSGKIGAALSIAGLSSWSGATPDGRRWSITVSDRTPHTLDPILLLKANVTSEQIEKGYKVGKTTTVVSITDLDKKKRKGGSDDGGTGGDDGLGA